MSDTNRYKVKVLGDEGSEETVYEIISPKPIDERMLLVCGMVLDGALTPELVRSEVPTAQAYASVNCDYREEWVDNALGQNFDETV